MKSQRIRNLPPPGPDKTGWPWIEEEGNPAYIANRYGGRIPKISIVTPNFNGAKFLEETLRSVLLQGYPNLEYIVIDGGSSDGSVEIIKKYEPYLHFWKSEPDNGQAQAINKGLAHCTGDIVAFLNSDDLYLPGALDAVGRLFTSSPDVMWVCGACDLMNEATKTSRNWKPSQFSHVSEYVLGNPAAQPATFLNASVVQKLGGFDECMHYSFDLEYVARMAIAGFRPILTEETLALFRLHDLSKTCTQNTLFMVDDVNIAKRYKERLQPTEQKTVGDWIDRAERMIMREECLRKSHGNGAIARLRLVQSILRRPDLLSDRATWGALRRPHRAAPG